MNQKSPARIVIVGTHASDTGRRGFRLLEVLLSAFVVFFSQQVAAV
jgi:hypothetical protein